MESGIDFMQFLEMDVSLYIMGFLDDPVDIVRASAVSRFWHNLVIANEFAKRLCLRKFPGITSVFDVVNTSKGMLDSVEAEYTSEEWAVLRRDQQVYASLLLALTKSNVVAKDFIENAVSASSTDNYPIESVVHTLNPKDKLRDDRPSYWSSKGEANPDVPETLIYKLHGGIWLLTGVDVQPFEAYFQPGEPIYSAKFVRFRYGHPKSPEEFKTHKLQYPCEKPADDSFVWTYTSPEFPMAQNDCLQQFMLPEPVLCVGGYLQIELLGRVQQQEMDGLYYICVCYARALGRPLYPAFDIEKAEPNEKPLLKFNPKNLKAVLKRSSSGKNASSCKLEEEMLLERLHVLELFFRRMQGGFAQFYGALDEEEEDDGGEEYFVQVVQQVINNPNREVGPNYVSLSEVESEDEDDEESEDEDEETD